MMERCRRDRARAAAVQAMVKDPRARREFLWLRAREKGDDASIEYLERVDPDLAEGMRAYEGDLPRSLDPAARARTFGALCNALLARATADQALDSIPCDCARCRDGRAS